MDSLLKNALKALQKHYCKILLINRKADAYYPIILEEQERQWEKVGKLTEFAQWFLRNGNIYEQDKPLFQKFIKECFVEQKSTFLFYRRKCNDVYRWAFIFLEKTDIPEQEYLYVRDVNDIYIEQCDIVLDNVACIDPLTSFGNKFAYNNDVMDKDSITYVSINNLANINMDEGYDYGDEIISKVAEIIECHSTQNYRISGGMFALVNVSDKQALTKALNGLATVK